MLSPCSGEGSNLKLGGNSAALTTLGATPESRAYLSLSLGVFAYQVKEEASEAERGRSLIPFTAAMVTTGAWPLSQEDREVAMETRLEVKLRCGPFPPYSKRGEAKTSPPAGPTQDLC